MQASSRSNRFPSLHPSHCQARSSPRISMIASRAPCRACSIKFTYSDPTLHSRPRNSSPPLFTKLDGGLHWTSTPFTSPQLTKPLSRCQPHRDELKRKAVPTDILSAYLRLYLPTCVPTHLTFLDITHLPTPPPKEGARPAHPQFCPPQTHPQHNT
jgi:hypothetical protein